MSKPASQYYPPQPSFSTGLKGACPRCGQGRMFAGYLKVADECDVCGLSFGFSDAGDGAAWFVMLIAGTLAMCGVLIVELTWQPAYWVHALVAIPLAVLLPMLMLRPVKGILLARQHETNAQLGQLSRD